MMDAFRLSVTAPVCSFRRPYAREYLETERVPPPSTVYGFLLSLIGEEDRSRYTGTLLAIALLGQPSLSTVLRTTWRIKEKKSPPGMGRNRKPDYQEVLTHVCAAVFVQEGPLEAALRSLAENPASVERFGGLSLGESRDLVDEVRFFPDWSNVRGHWLRCDPEGVYPLPLWVDHVGSKGTRWGQFSLWEAPLGEPPQDDPRWITIKPPEQNVSDKPKKKQKKEEP